MDASPGQAAIYRFAGYVLDPSRAALHGPDGAAIDLRPKSYGVLLHLVRNARRVVTRDALFETVWPGVTVGDEAITQCVRDVRRALGGSGPALLRTLPRRGYMLDATVHVDDVVALNRISRPSEAPLQANLTAPTPVGAIRADWRSVFNHRWATAWLTAGVTCLIAVPTVLATAVWMAGPRPTFSADQVRQTATVAALDPREEAVRLTREAIHLGRIEGGRVTWLRQRELFIRATEVDPGYAPAWIHLVFTYTNMLANGFSVNGASDLRAAEAAAERGMALAPESPDAHAALCTVLRRHSGRLEEALAACRHAVELAPTSHPARANFGWMLLLLGRTEEGKAAIQASIASAPANHPLQTIWHYYFGIAQLFSGRDDEAVAAFRRGLFAWRVDDQSTLLGLIAALALSGQRAEAEHLLAEARQRWPDLSIAHVRANSPSQHENFLAHRERLLSGLALAGLP